MNKSLREFITQLEFFTLSKDRHIKGHAIALLKRLQELNPQDDD